MHRNLSETLFFNFTAINDDSVTCSDATVAVENGSQRLVGCVYLKFLREDAATFTDEDYNQTANKNHSCYTLFSFDAQEVTFTFCEYG